MEKNSVPDILIIDDVVLNGQLLIAMIKRMGYEGRAAVTANQAFEMIKEKLPQLILLDVSMPDMDGYQICEVLKANPTTRQIPVIFVSAEEDMSSKIKAFEVGGIDFLKKPVEYMEVNVRVNTYLKMYKMQQQLEENNRRLNRIINEQSIMFEEEQKRLLKAIAKLAEGSEFVGMSRHIDNISANSRLLAQALNFTEKYENKISGTFVETIEIASSVHDIGKITISNEILNKPGTLTPHEREVVNTHSIKGEELLKAAYPDLEKNQFIKMAAEVIRYHHENWDGSGYPEGLKGEDIPLSARIVRIVDSYDCILGERCYKAAQDKSVALDIMREGSGKQYDPYLLDVFFKIERQLKKD